MIREPWTCAICSLVGNVEYVLPSSSDLRCRECGGRPHECELLRHEIAQLRAELGDRALLSARPFAAGGTATAQMMTAKEAAEFLRLPSVRALYQQVWRGRVKAHRFGRQYRFSRSELAALIGPK